MNIPESFMGEGVYNLIDGKIVRGSGKYNIHRYFSSGDYISLSLSGLCDITLGIDNGNVYFKEYGTAGGINIFNSLDRRMNKYLRRILVNHTEDEYICLFTELFRVLESLIEFTDSIRPGKSSLKRAI
jgi:hypothetical protein